VGQAMAININMFNYDDSPGSSPWKPIMIGLNHDDDDVDVRTTPRPSMLK
jgi:hypothetical protein